MKRDVTQSAETQQKANPYSPFTSYNDYCNQIIFMAMDMNDITRGVPPLMIADLWLLTPIFADCFEALHTWHTSFIAKTCSSACCLGADRKSVV